MGEGWQVGARASFSQTPLHERARLYFFPGGALTARLKCYAVSTA